MHIQVLRPSFLTAFLITTAALPAFAVAPEPGLPAGVVPRRAIAAIVDFPGHVFEDGTGVNSVAELQRRLDITRMRWSSLSNGREQLQWTLVRFTVSGTLDADSYDDLALFRAELAGLVRDRVDPRRFDADRDGEIDTVLVVLANHGRYFPWLGRGARPDAGAYQFVELQDGPWLAPGEILHELGATLGLAELRGAFNNVSRLSLMSEPQTTGAGFTAVERARLGWLQPTLLPPGQHVVQLVYPGDALRIATARPTESFVLEYARSIGSGHEAGLKVDGLLVHHVLEGSTQQFDPPLHKVEAADGDLAPGTPINPSDVITTGWSQWHDPVLFTSYVEGAPAVRVEDVSYFFGGSLLVTVTVFAPPSRPDLLDNGGFEAGTALSSARWRTDAWTPTSRFFRDRWRPFAGRFTASIKSLSPNDARWVQDVDGLEPGAPYLLCGALRGRDVTRAPGVEVGGNLSVLGMGWFDRSSAMLYGTFGWQRVCYAFNAPAASVSVACRLGFYSSLARGQLWCDDVTLEPLTRTFSPP
jgi:hypothetical protein